jgi:hypothetical protein
VGSVGSGRESMIAAEALLLAGIPSVGRSMRAILVAVPCDHSIRS